MKKYLIALSLVGLVSTSCYEKLNIAPPNSITNEQVMELLRTGNDETVTSIMGALAEASARPDQRGRIRYLQSTVLCIQLPIAGNYP